MKPFEQLSAQGKIRRYHQMARLALKSYPIRVKKLRCLSIRHNVIFRVDADEGMFALRIGYPEIRTALMVESEMRWLEDMQSAIDLTLSYPIRTKDNQLLVTCELEGIPESRHIVLMAWMKGQLLSIAPTEKKLLHLGMALARLHNFSDNYAPSTPFMSYDVFRCDEWGGLAYLDDDNPLLTNEQKTHFRQAIETSEMALIHWRKHNGLKLIHADLHLKNANWYRGQIGIFDFDDCRWGHFLQDWGVILSWFRENEHESKLLRDTFIAGYQTERPLIYSDRDLKLATMHRRMWGLTFVVNHRPLKRQAAIDEAYRWLQANL